MGVYRAAEERGLDATRSTAAWALPRRRSIRRVRHGIVLGLLALLLVGMTVSAHLYTVDPLRQTLGARLTPVWTTRAGEFYPLGSDGLGRDILARAIAGAQTSLLIGVLSVFSGALVGVTLGLSSGYFGGWVDTVIMRLVDVQMSMPFLVLALILSAVLGPGIRNTVIALAMTSWIVYARVARAEALALRRREFVEAACSLGAGHGRIMIRHILPNLMNTLTVVATQEVGQMMLLAAALSFLGLGVPPPLASLGGMVKEGQAYLFTGWWVSTIPGTAIMALVLLIVLSGEAFREILDPLGR